MELISFFLNTAAEDLTLLDPELKLFYDYIRKGRADSDLARTIDNKIAVIKENIEVRGKYMTYTTRIAEAKSEAFEDGFSAGEEHGISLGITQAKLETAKSMIQRNIAIDIIAECTGLSVEEIEKL